MTSHNERAPTLENQAIAIKLTKLVAAQSKPVSGADVFRVSTDLLSVYRYILADLNSKHKEHA
jgi:hypothetical protein